MRSYRVLVHASRPPILVREGFSFWAFLFGPLWLLFSAAWIPALIAIVLEILVRLILPHPARAIAGFGLAWLIGLFARDLRCWSLERGGWRLAHIVVAPSRAAADLRLLASAPDLHAAYAA